MKYLFGMMTALLFFNSSTIYGAEKKVGRTTTEIHATVQLTQEEKRFLRQHPVITAHNEADYPPKQ